MPNPLLSTVDDLARPRPLLVFLEVSVVTLLLPALGLWGHPQDPFFVGVSFPWLVLGPLLLALRYGFAQGAGSAAVLNLLMYAFFRAGRLGVPSFPGSLALGMLLIAMLAGEFCDMWRRRQHRLSELNYHHHNLVERFTRSYRMLSLSHEQLERRVLADTRSLRETMTYLRERALAVDTDSPDSPALYHPMMEVLSSFGRLQVAALYRVDAYGIIIPQIVAKLGNPTAVPIDDPMLIAALKSKQLTCIRSEESPAQTTEESGPTRISKTLLLVIPLLDVHGRLWGVVTVQAIPFEALSRNHLNLLAVIGGQMGDLLTLGSAGGMHQFHTCLMRSHSDARAHRLPAMLLGLIVDPSKAPPSLWSTLLDQHRGLDQQWLTHDKHGHRVLLLVMPLTDAAGARGFIQRLDSWCKDIHGRSLAEAGIRSHQVALDGVGPARDKLAALRQTCEINGAYELSVG